MKQSMYIFDVDGVLNDLRTAEADDRLLTYIAGLLEQGIFVAINTGRDYAWVETYIIQQLETRLQGKKPLARMFVATEMGGIGVEFMNGEAKRTVSERSLPPEYINAVKRIFETHAEYPKIMRWYGGKESMATVCRKPEVDHALFRPAQKALISTLKEVFKEQPVKVSHSANSIDIHSPIAGKDAGAQLVYQWLGRVSSISHNHYVCFGDSGVDYEMARFFAQKNHEATFIFSGVSLDEVELDPGIRVVRTEPQYNEGVYLYLKSNGTGIRESTPTFI